MKLVRFPAPSHLAQRDVAKTDYFPSEIILVSGAKPNPKFHLADVPILRNLERIDNTSSVTEMGRILKLIYGFVRALRHLMTIGYGAVEGSKRVNL